MTGLSCDMRITDIIANIHKSVCNAQERIQSKEITHGTHLIIVSIYSIAFYCYFTIDVNLIETYLTCFNSVLPSLSEVSLVGMMCISADEKVMTHQECQD